MNGSNKPTRKQQPAVKSARAIPAARPSKGGAPPGTRGTASTDSSLAEVKGSRRSRTGPVRSKDQDAWSVEASYGGIGGRIRGGLSPNEDGFRSNHLRSKYKRQTFDIAEKPPRLEESEAAPRTDDFIEFDEVITTVSGSSTFSIQHFDVNPGLASTFPRSSIQSSQYTGYTFGFCEFYYRPTITEFTSSGKVMMSFDLDGADSIDPVSNAEMENNTIHRDGMPHQSMGFEIAGVSRKLKYNFVRTGPVLLGADPKLADVGRLWLAVNGTPTGLIGELRVRGWLKAKDRLQNPAGFALPLYLTQVFLPAVYPAVDNVDTTIGFTFTPPTVSTGLGFAPYSDLDPINVSGWAVSAGQLLAPASAVYQITVHATFYDASNTLTNCRLIFVGNDGSVQKEAILTAADAPSNLSAVTLSGTFAMPMAIGRSLIAYYRCSDVGGNTIRFIGAVLTIITM